MELAEPKHTEGHKANDQSERDSEEEIYVSKVEIKDFKNVINAWDGEHLMKFERRDALSL